MAFRFTVVNLPSPAKYWSATFYINEQEEWPGVAASEGEFISYSRSGLVSHFVVGLYDNQHEYLGPEYTKDIYYGVSVEDGEDYRFNWQTNQFEQITEEVVISNLRALVTQQYPHPGESVTVQVLFDYEGGDRIGNTATKVAIGHKRLFYFDEVQPMVWSKIINLYGTDSYMHQYDITIPSDVTPDIYDLKIEVGSYPWSTKVFAERIYEKAFNILEPGELPPEIPPEEKKFPWLPVALIGGGAVLVGSALVKSKKRSS